MTRPRSRTPILNVQRPQTNASALLMPAKLLRGTLAVEIPTLSLLAANHWDEPNRPALRAIEAAIGLFVRED